MQEDVSPSLKKLYEVDDGFVLQNITGIRAHIVSRLDGKGYDLVKCQSFRPPCLLKARLNVFTQWLSILSGEGKWCTSTTRHSG